MEKFLKYNINPVITEKNSQLSKIVISPLEKGMGNTLGNALRRTLLFDIPGSSLFAIKINNATHEFQGLNGIKEDITQIILNLKGLVIKIDEHAYSDDELEGTKIEQWPVMEIVVKGKSIIHASDIKCPIGFEIVNKDLYICELTTDSAKLDLKLYATRGRGFTTFSTNHEKVNSLSIIATDSNFSPIVRVNYSVDEIKISKNKIGDELTIELLTNGAISPNSAIAFAAKILSEHLEPLINIDATINEYKLIQKQKETEQQQTLSISIDEMNLSVRSYNCLKRAGIQSVEQLTNKTKTQVEHIKNLGKKSLREIQRKLTELGLGFKEATAEDILNEEVSETEGE